MYEQIQRTQRKRGNRKLWISLILWGVVAAVLTALIIFGFRYRANFREFLGDLSDSTQYALDNNSLYLTVEGDTFLVIRKNIRKFYNAVAIAGSGRLVSAPDRQADILLDYGNGCTLELWQTQVKNARNNRGIGMVVRYTDGEGKTYTYDTDRLRPEKFPLTKPTLNG
ncbi:MAG: hypothetical protein IKU58_02270 [Clostridia bacterium]|nr:hypothetical protein [Clostridia bacterium]